MQTDYLLAYGSLLNSYSREVVSGISGSMQRAELSGWTRAWCVAYPDEFATYAGAVPRDGQSLDVLLVPTHISPELQHREREYRFTQIDQCNVKLAQTSEDQQAAHRYFVCETMQFSKPTPRCPLPQSYVDTCLIGCYEIGGVQAMHRFIEQTQGWQASWVNDRSWQQPIYPRGAVLTTKQSEMVDALLAEHKLLQWRNND